MIIPYLPAITLYHQMSRFWYIIAFVSAGMHYGSQSNHFQFSLVPFFRF